jgi:hypothetical protein
VEKWIKPTYENESELTRVLSTFPRPAREWSEGAPLIANY